MFQLKKLLLTVKFANFSCQRLAQFPARFGATLIIACWATIINAQKIEIYFSFLHDTAIGLTKKNYFKGETYYCKPQNTPPPHRKLTSSQRQPPPNVNQPPPPPIVKSCAVHTVCSPSLPIPLANGQKMVMHEYIRVPT